MQVVRLFCVMLYAGISQTPLDMMLGAAVGDPNLSALKEVLFLPEFVVEGVSWWHPLLLPAASASVPYWMPAM